MQKDHAAGFDPVYHPIGHPPGIVIEPVIGVQAPGDDPVAEAEGISDRYVGALMPLAFLAPDIVARILAGTQPVELTTEVLAKRIDLPLAWAEQKLLMGLE